MQVATDSRSERGLAMADKRSDRQIGILMLLRSKEWISAKVLAEQFEVSQRTIYRDVEDLLTRGVPIEGVPGPDGGYRLKSETPLDPLVFSSEDALSLWLLGSSSTTTPPAVRTRWNELEASASPADFQERLLNVSSAARRVHFDTADWYWRDEGSTHLTALRTAVFGGQAILLTYQAPGSASNADVLVKPYGLVWKAGEWYLVGAPVDAPTSRYRLNSITRVASTELTFPYPEDFDLESWWNQHMEEYGQGDIRVELAASAGAGPELLRLSLKENSEVDIAADGSMRLVLFVDSWQWLVPLLASYGGSVVASTPSELRAAVLNYFRAGVAAYNADDGQRPFDQSESGFVADDSRVRTTRGRPD